LVIVPVSRTLSLDSVDCSPDEYGVVLNVDVLRNTPAEDQSFQVQISMENTTTEPVIFKTDFVRLFAGFESKERDPGLYIIPSGYPLKFKTTFRPIAQSIIFDAIQQSNRVAPMDIIRGEFDILDHPENTGGVFQPGTYRFESEYYDTGGSMVFKWGFSVELYES
jgi:hypothetical protein